MKSALRITAAILLLTTLLLAAAVLSLTVFLRGSGLRERVELTLTKALARKVTIRRLDLSLRSGGLLAEGMTVAEDEHISTSPFLTADTVQMQVELLPLLLHRQVRLDRFVFQSPSIHLIQTSGGSWNITTLGRSSTVPPALTTVSKPHKRLPDLAVSSIEIRNGQITTELRSNPDTHPALQTRTYQHVDLTLHDFTLTRPFPIRLSASLPGEGAILATGHIGPLLPLKQNPSATATESPAATVTTPLNLHLEAIHLDLARAGLVTASSRIQGQINHLTLDLTGTTRDLHATSFVANIAKLNISPEPAEPTPTLHTSTAWSAILDHLQLDKADLRISSLAIERSHAAPLICEQVQAEIKSFASGHWANFTANAVMASGTLHATGKALLPQHTINTATSNRFSLDTTLSATHLNLAHSGLLPASSPIAGLADLQAHLQTSGDQLRIEGTTRIRNLKLSATGQPSPQAVQARFTMNQQTDPATGTTIGRLQQATFLLPGATVNTINLTGRYAIGQAPPSVDLQAHSEAVPIDSIEAFLPGLGIHLPDKSRLQGGTLTTTLALSGPVSDLTISGPIRLENTRLAGFDLGSRLTSLARWTGGRIGSATPQGTSLRFLSLNLHATRSEIETGNLSASIVGLGTATGQGSIHPGGALDYHLLLNLTELSAQSSGSVALAQNLAGQLPGKWAARARGLIQYLSAGPLKDGIPVLVGGTAQHPVFTPNLGALIPK